MSSPDDWFAKLPSRRGDPDEIVAARIDRHNALRRREHLIRVATRTLRSLRLWPDDAPTVLAEVAEMRREAASIPKEQPGE